jgi:hypoxanthine phosphoribosyltransferase
VYRAAADPFHFLSYHRMSREGGQVPAQYTKVSRADAFVGGTLFVVSLPALHTTQEIQEAITRIAGEITRDYGDEPVLLVGVLKGSLYFLADLSRALGENVTIDLIQVSSYGKARESSGIVKILKDLDDTIEGKNVILVEDIVDTGKTLSHLIDVFTTRRPKSLAIAALLSKPAARKISVKVNYVGYEIPNKFVVGYGLDDGEKYRNLPYIAVLPTGEPAYSDPVDPISPPI